MKTWYNKEWNEVVSFIQNNYIYCIICLFVLIFIILFFQITSFFRRFRKKTINRSTLSISFPIILLIIFSCFVLMYIKTNYDAYKKAIENNSISVVELSVVDMQASTLAISALVVTLASIILTILTLYHEKRNEENKKDIEKSVQKIKQTETELRTLASLTSIQFIDERQRECYFDAIQQYIESKQDISENFLYAHFRIAYMNIIDGLSKNETNRELQLEHNNSIVMIAREILTSESSITLEKEIALLGMLHSLYQIIRLKIDTCPSSARDDIRLAMSYMKRVSTASIDSYGHIANIKGLINMWSGIAMARTGENRQAIQYLKKSLPFFDAALDKSPNKIEFLNHKAVALQQLYDQNKILNDESIKEQLLAILDRMLSINPQYPKALLNKASLIVREIRKELSLPPLSMFPDYSKVKLSITSSKYSEVKKMAQQAEELLDKLQKIHPMMINVHYKMGELLTLSIVLIKHKNQNYNKEKNKAVISFNKARELNPNHLSYLYCRYAFSSLFPDEMKKEQEEIKDQIISQQTNPNGNG